MTHEELLKRMDARLQRLAELAGKMSVYDRIVEDARERTKEITDETAELMREHEIDKLQRNS